MGTRRLGLALFAALVISIAITSIFYIRVTRAQGSATPATRHVIAAAVAVQPGVPLTAENLTEVNWPVNVPLEGLIEKKEDAVGRVPIYALEPKEPLQKRGLASNGSFGISAKIPDGMRATSVKTNEVMNIAGFIFPGSHVDVLVTLRGENNASTTTHTVLQNVQVLATGTKTDPDPNGKPENVSVVTLLVTPEESEKLALAQSQATQNQGSIHFVLRNGGDAARPNTAPIDMAELAGIPKKAPQPLLPRVKRVAVPAAPTAYTVETFSGGKVTVAKFPAND
ncbi:MAG TPA: Flp pilus assembly protein CpaB [Candidatus Angelobacter sp.]|jgi:pilus assembly protein CpaB|nr:Flp pilus assembly protein CpaB [Candidatus Angelobacter sp.]